MFGPDPANRTRSMAVLRTAAFPLGQVGSNLLAPGEGLEPPSRGSEPRVLPVRRPWCGALDGNRTRLQLLDRRPPAPAGLESVSKGAVVVVRRGGFAPPQHKGHGVTNLCTPRNHRFRGDPGLGSLGAPAGASTPPRQLFGLPCLFGFQGA